MNQGEKIMEHLKKYGSITGMECIMLLGVMNYKGRISDLRKLGVPITRRWETHVNKDGEKKTFARYYLEGRA